MEEFTYQAKQDIIYDLEQLIDYSQQLRVQMDKSVSQQQFRQKYGQMENWLSAIKQVADKSENFQ